MRLPRFSISWLMLAVALCAVHFAVVCSYPPLFNLGHANLEIGLLPSITLGAAMLFSTRTWRAGEKRPFAWSFLTGLVVATGAYVILCFVVPEFVKWPVVYYINNIEPELYDADLDIVYRLSLEIDGLILGVPQLLFATCAGLIGCARRRRFIAVDSKSTLR